MLQKSFKNITLANKSKLHQVKNLERAEKKERKI